MRLLKKKLQSTKGFFLRWIKWLDDALFIWITRGSFLSGSQIVLCLEAFKMNKSIGSFGKIITDSVPLKCVLSGIFFLIESLAPSLWLRSFRFFIFSLDLIHLRILIIILNNKISIYKYKLYNIYIQNLLNCLAPSWSNSIQEFIYFQLILTFILFSKA